MAKSGAARYFESVSQAHHLSIARCRLAGRGVPLHTLMLITITRIIKRGDIYYAELNPVIGSEQGGTRPVLIISNDIGNKHSPTVIIAAITSRVHTKAKLPTHTAVTNYEGLDKDSVILLEQIRTIDKQRLKQYMGMMPNNIMARVDKALAISVALKKI